MIAPLVVVGEVIGALKHEMEIIAIVHRGLTETQHSGCKSILLTIMIVSTVGGGESESVHNVKTSTQIAHSPCAPSCCFSLQSAQHRGFG